MRIAKWIAGAAAASLTWGIAAGAQARPATDSIFAAARKVQPRVVEWRRDIHRHPELSNRETRTAGLVAAHLKALGMEVRTGIAHHGVIGVLKGGRPGGVVALRADMDALPVKELTGLPFASTVTAQEGGETVPVMHACGHDVHVAMLMGAAQVLAGMKRDIQGTVVFVFQPSEEWTPPGEEAGAKLLMKEKALADLHPGAIFATHVWPDDTGRISIRQGGFFANEDNIRLVLKGKQTHGARPWGGIDIVSLTAQIVTGLNTIVARQSDLTIAPAVVTIATIHGGVRSNIIPEEMTLTGTIRTLDNAMREDILKRVRRVVETTAAAYEATAELEISPDYPLTYNDPALTAALIPSIERAAGPGNVDRDARAALTSEDFSYYLKDIPGVYWLLGTGRMSVAKDQRPPNHSPYYDIDEEAMEVGVRTHVTMALDYLSGVAAHASP
jgi:amidohydrolase